MSRIFFVCHGNTCRSPMAAEIFRHISNARRVNGISVDSFGINPCIDDDHDIKALREEAVAKVMGGLIELSNHKPKGIESVRLRSEDLLVLLNPTDQSILKDQVANAGVRPRIMTWNIEDPYQQSVEKYIEIATILKNRIDRDFLILTTERPDPT